MALTESPPAEPAQRLLILARSRAWDARFQVSSFAASAAAMGTQVDVALFFAALSAWVDEAWDDLDVEPGLDVDADELSALPSLSELLRPGCELDRIRFYACSASTRLLGLDPARVQARVVAIVGWPSFNRMAERATTVVAL